MTPKKCINKSLKSYKDLAERYGEALASSIIRKIDRSSETKSDEFYIPSISETKKLIKESKLEVVEKFDNVIRMNPFMKERAILDYLQGIVRKKDNTVFVVKGYEAGMLDTEIVEKEIFQQNLRIIEDLKAKYPDIFEISPTPKRNVVVVKITPRIQKPPTYSQGVISFPPSKLSVAHLEEVKKNIIENLPEEVANTIEVLREVPLDIIGTPGLQLSMQSILEKTDISDPMLIAWLGYNKDLVKVTSVKSTNQLESIIQNSYNQRIKNAKPFLKGDAKVQFDNWVTSLEKYPLAFKDLLLKYAIKNLIDPKRTNKFVIALSPVALNGAFTEVSNQPHKVQQVGKIYNAHLLRTTSDATEHEPSASGKGYWVHVPRTSSGNYLGYTNYQNFKNKTESSLKSNEEILERYKEKQNPEYYKSLLEELKKLEAVKPVFNTQEPYLNREEANSYGFQEFEYVRVESSHGRGYDNPFPKFLGQGYKGYYIHGYNTREGKPDYKVVPITKAQAEEIWNKRDGQDSYYAREVEDQNKIYNLKEEIKNYNPEKVAKTIKETEEIINKLKKQLETVKPEDWKDNAAQFKANVELLKKLSPQTWCTASSMASHYVENYDNYLLIVDGRTVAGIEAMQETNNSKKIENIKATILNEKTKWANAKVEKDGLTEYGFITLKTKSEKFIKELEEELITLEKENKIQVKEVTSIANNGVAPIDHLDDILAFFEKHNLNTNNESLKNAINARQNGKTDKDLFEIYTEPEGPYNPYGEGYDMDGYHLEPDWEAEEAYYREREENQRIMMEAEANERDQASDIQEPEKAIEFLRNAQFDIFDYMSVEMRSNQQVAEAAIEKDAHNITFVPENLPFYKELAHKAVTKSPFVFAYISDEAKAEQRNIDIHNEYVERNRILEDDLPFSKTKDSQIQGYYNPRTDKVVVISSNIETNEAARIGIHEVAHRGMLRMARDLGGVNQLYDVLSSAKKQLMEKLPLLLERTGHKTLEDLMVDYGFNKDSKAGELKLLMELAARWSETLVDKPKPSWWNRLLQNIGQWIKQFVGIDLTESQVDQLVGGFVQYGTTKEKLTFDESLQFSKTAQPIKPGVQELFESNPELANDVYEALGFKQKQYASKLKEISQRRKLATKWDLENSQLIKDIRVDKTQPKELKPNAADNNLAAIMLYGMKMSELEDKGLPEEMMEATTLAYRILNDFMFDINELSFYQNILLENPEYAQTLTTNENPVKEFFENDIFEQVEKDKFQIIPQQKQQALQLYSQYLDSITNEPIVYKGLRDKSTKVHDTPNHSYFTPDKNIADKWYKDEKGVKTFVIPKVESVEFRSDSSQGVSKFRKDEENFINNAQQPLIKLDTYDIGFRQIQYVLNKNIAPLELGTEKDIKEFKQFIEKSDLSKTAETFEKPEKVIKFTSFEDIEKLKKGKPC